MFSNICLYFLLNLFTVLYGIKIYFLLHSTYQIGKGKYLTVLRQGYFVYVLQNVRCTVLLSFRMYCFLDLVLLLSTETFSSHTSFPVMEGP